MYAAPTWTGDEGGAAGRAISCGPGPSGTSSCSIRLPPLIAAAAYLRADDVHREDEGPAGEVGIDRVTMES